MVQRSSEVFAADRQEEGYSALRLSKSDESRR